ncbi:MAG TPA: GxxExxY protein [Stellaceae bacterium]|nr:GxxExxY protein [Stellaceae bacterium]
MAISESKVLNRQDAKFAKKAEPSSEHDATARQIVDSAFAVHRALGPGLLESVYEQCLERELRYRNISVARQVALPLVYRDEPIEVGFRIDMLVNDLVIVEIKAIEKLLPIHDAQLLTYLRLSRKQVGLLINFNTVRIKEGIRRLVNS